MLEMRHISKRFGDRQILSDISLNINKGEIVSILGPSGCGKTTLLNLILGLTDLTEGQLVLDGEDLSHVSMKDRGFNIVFQDFALFPNLNARENILYGLRNNPTASTPKEVEELIDLLGLRKHLEQRIDELSGGQKQRVAIARALANDPKVLLCDEATSALDPQTTHSILKLLKEVNQKLKLTIVVITHQMSVIKEICDRVAVMKTGRIVEEGSITDIFAHPKADLTKEFINTANNVKKFLGLVESGQLDSEVANGGKILLLTYTGGSAGEPLVVALYERFKVRANIVFGNIDFIQGAALGKLGVVLTGEKESVIQAEEYLKQNGVYVEELKNGLH